MSEDGGLAWSLYVELRKEILATQGLRSRAIEFKITIVGAAIALFVANRDKLGDDRVLVLPALAALFFDFLIGSYSFAIKRKGRYLRDHVEPWLRREGQVPTGQVLWEEYLARPEQKQMFAAIANLGLTVLALVPAFVVLLSPPIAWLDIATTAVLLILVTCVACIYGHVDYLALHRLFRIGAPRQKPPESERRDADRSTTTARPG